MAQKYKVYFANRPVVFSEGGSNSARKGCKFIQSGGKTDTMMIESAIAAGAREVDINCFDIEKAWKSFCGQFDFVQAAGGVVLNPFGKVLFIFRQGKWDLPKGKVEEGESVSDGALREVEEECAISNLETIQPLLVTWHTYVQTGQPTLKATAWYLMHYTGSSSPRPQLEEGITETRWFGAEELALVRSNTYPSVLDVIDSYQAALAGHSGDSPT